MKNLHICNTDKFIPPFIEFVRQNFLAGENQFAVVAGVRAQGHPYKAGPDARRYQRIWQLPRLAFDVWRSDKVIIHGLFSRVVIVLLWFMPWAHKKMYWVMWGGDLYAHVYSRDTWKHKVKESLKRVLIRRIGGLLTYLPRDVALARKWYGARGRHCDCLMYESNVYVPRGTESMQHAGINIQVGNSASPSNNHAEVFDYLQGKIGQDCKVFVPLSYGDEMYAEEVIRVGRERFGPAFFPITEFVPQAEYIRHLSSIDVAIFNHERQQAMGNTITLLGMGKKVYMRTDVAQWELLQSIGVKVFDVGKIELTALDESIAIANRERVANYFSREKLVEQYANILA